MARSLLKAKGLSNSFWAEAVVTTVYLFNISPTKAVMKKISFEAWSGRKPLVSHLKFLIVYPMLYSILNLVRNLMKNLKNVVLLDIIINQKQI